MAFGQAAPPARSVRVVKGDTLEAIAARHGVSVQELMRLNRITSPETLQIGQELKLPAAKGQVQVRSGDTLEILATRHRTTVAALRKANPAVKPDQLKVGAWLRLPPATARPKPASKEKPPVKEQPSSKGSGQPPAPAKAPAPAKPQERPAAVAAPVSPPAVPAVAPSPGPPPAPSATKQEQPVRWKFFGNTLVDWDGWKLHPGGVRVTLVQPTEADVGPSRARASAVAVHCNSLRQAWLVNGVWESWGVPEPRSVPQQIVLDLCANVTDLTGPSIPPPAAP